VPDGVDVVNMSWSRGSDDFLCRFDILSIFMPVPICMFSQRGYKHLHTAQWPATAMLLE
jgi:hypothetical protein